MKPSPKYYPQAPGTIELAGQAIIRVQRRYGVGSEEALRFSYEIQRCIWVTEEGDHTDVEVLRGIARRCGLSEEAVEQDVVDRRGEEKDAGGQEWRRNHEEAVQLGELIITTIHEVPSVHLDPLWPDHGSLLIASKVDLVSGPLYITPVPTMVHSAPRTLDELDELMARYLWDAQLCCERRDLLGPRQAGLRRDACQGADTGGRATDAVRKRGLSRGGSQRG
jgi:hypothetical protein